MAPEDSRNVALPAACCSYADITGLAIARRPDPRRAGIESADIAYVARVFMEADPTGFPRSHARRSEMSDEAEDIA